MREVFREWIGRVFPVPLLSALLVGLIVALVTAGYDKDPQVAGLSNLLNLHAVLATLGLATLAVALLTRRLSSVVHSVSSAVGVALLSASGGVVYVYKQKHALPPTPHLYASHQVLGFVAMALLAGEAVVAVVFLLARSFEFWLPRHRLFGLFSVVGLYASLASGVSMLQTTQDLSVYPYNTHAFRFSFLYVGENFFVLFAVLQCAMVLYLLAYPNVPSTTRYEPIVN